MTAGVLADKLIEVLKRAPESNRVYVNYYDLTGTCRANVTVIDLRFDTENDVVILEIEEETGAIVEEALCDAIERAGGILGTRIAKPDDPNIEIEM